MLRLRHGQFPTNFWTLAGAARPGFRMQPLPLNKGKKQKVAEQSWRDQVQSPSAVSAQLFNAEHGGFRWPVSSDSEGETETKAPSDDFVQSFNRAHAGFRWESDPEEETGATCVDGINAFHAGFPSVDSDEEAGAASVDELNAFHAGFSWLDQTEDEEEDFHGSEDTECRVEPSLKAFHGREDTDCRVEHSLEETVREYEYRLKRSGGAVSVTASEKKAIYKLVKLIETPGWDADIRQLVFETPNGKGATYVLIRQGKKTDATVGPETMRKRAKLVNGICEMVGWGSNALGRLMSRRKGLAEVAATKAGLKCAKVTLTMDESFTLMGLMQLSWNKALFLRRFFAGVGAPLAMASISSMKKVLKSFEVLAVYRREALQSGSKGATKDLDCIISSRSIMHLLIEERDRATVDGTIIESNFACDRDLQHPIANILLSSDQGGGQDKHTGRCLDRKTPQSPLHQLTFATAETERRDNAKSHLGNHANFSAIVREVDGIFDINSMVFVELGGMHTMIPAQTVPNPWAWSVIDDGAPRTSFLLSAWGIGNPRERAQARAEMQPGAATLVVCKGLCLGVRVGPVTYPFRTSVGVDVGAAPTARTILVRTFVSADLKALTTTMGCHGQAGCSCMWCDLPASGFKLSAANATVNGPPRTDASLADAFSKYIELRGPDPTPVRGVSALPVYPMPFGDGSFKDGLFNPGRVIIPYLHAIMGPINDTLKFMNVELGLLDGLNPKRLRDLQVLAGAESSRELELVEAILVTGALLGVEDAVVIEIIGGNDVGLLVDGQPLSVWQRLGASLTALATRKAEEAEGMDDGPDRVTIEELVEEVIGVKARLDSSTEAVKTARADLKTLEDQAAGPGPFGTLSMTLKQLLSKAGISLQKYWMGTLVGTVVDSCRGSLLSLL